MYIVDTRTHPLGDVYLLRSDNGILLESYFSGDYTQSSDTLRLERYGSLGKIDVRTKSIVKISVMGGCPYNCKPCDAGRAGYFGKASALDMIEQFAHIIDHQGLDRCDKLKLHVSKLGEPSLNWPATFEAFHAIVGQHPQFAIIPTISTLPRTESLFVTLVDDLFSWNHPRKQLKINLGASSESRRQDLYGNVLSLSSITRLLVDRLDTVSGQQRITLTLLAVPGETVNPEIFDCIPPSIRSAFTVELYKVNQTMNARQHGLSSGLIRYADANMYPTMEQLQEMGFFTYFSAPSNAEQTALIANGSSLVQIHV